MLQKFSSSSVYSLSTLGDTPRSVRLANTLVESSRCSSLIEGMRVRRTISSIGADYRIQVKVELINN